jgi:hypothetical protein
MRATGFPFSAFAGFREAATSTAASAPPSNGAGIASWGNSGPGRAVGDGKPAIVEPRSVTGAVMPALVWEVGVV